MKSQYAMAFSECNLPELSDAELSVIMGGHEYVMHEQLKNAGAQIQRGLQSAADTARDVASALRIPAAAALAYAARTAPHPVAQGLAAAGAVLLTAK